MISRLFTIFILVFSFSAFAQVSTDVVMSAGNNNTTFNTCLGGLYDSGGTGANVQYQNNESITVTVCPDVPGDFMTLQWTVFSLDPQNTHPNPNQTNADNITIYDGDDATAPTLGTYYSGDLTPGDLFGATSTNPTGCLTIVFNSNNVGTGDFNAQLSCATPCDPPTADGIIINADNAAGDSIAICVNEIVSFQDNGSTAGPSGLFTLQKWVWKWGDGTFDDTLLSGAPVNHTFANPGQYTVQLVVIDDNDCVNLNATDIRVFVSTYPTFVPFPGDTVLCIGESIELAAAPDSYEQTWSGFPAQTYDATNCMEDLTGISQPTPLTLSGFDPNISLNNANPDILSICVEIEHSFIGDFVLQVQCPTGQTMTLHQQGGGGTNLGDVTATAQGIIDCSDPSTFGLPWTYCFDATATDTWVQAITAGGNTIPNSGGGNSLIAGNYAPVDPLGFAALDGCPINGTWNLLFTDLWGADDGSLPGWSINFDPALYPPVTVFTPNIGNGTTGGTGSDSSYWQLTDPFIVSNTPDLDTIVVTPTNAGVFNYTYYAINNFGCAFDSTVSITVEALEPISAGPDVTLCGTTPVRIGPDSLSGGACDYTVLLVDSWGGGWNGNEVDITTSAGTTTYPGPPVDSIWINLPVINGETITVDFNNIGTNVFDCEITIYDYTGAIVYQDGVPGAPSNTPQTFTANCFAGYDFSWTPTTNMTGLPTDQNPFVSPPVQTVYTLSTFPTGHPDCVSSDDVIVQLGPDIDPGNDSIVRICIDAGQIDLIDYLGGTPQSVGYWINANGNILSMPIDASTLISGSTYQYRIDSNGCSLSAFLLVNIIDLPITIVATDVTCNSGADGEIDASSPMANSYSIDGGVTFQPATFFNGLSAGVYNVILASGPFGSECQATTVVTIAEPDPLVISFLTDDQTVCQNSTVDLSVVGTGGSSDYTYSWDGGIGTGSLVNYSPTISDSVCITLSEVCGSPTTKACLFVTVPAPIDFSYHFGSNPNALTSEGCYTHDFEIKNLSTSTDIVQGGVIVSPASILKETEWRIIGDKTVTTSGLGSLASGIEKPGIYPVEVVLTSDAGCKSTEYLGEIITVYDHPVADFAYTPDGISIFSTEAEFIDLSLGEPIAWDWSFQGAPSPPTSDDQNPMVKYQEGKPGSYQVDLTVTDHNGCMDTETKFVDISNDIRAFAPNIFTPDGDGYNDDWRVFITGIEIYDFHLTIYNRWGELVFESYDPEGVWDGKYGGDIIKGNYVWLIDTKDLENDNRYTFNGSIIISR
ncbi:MAG: PKD domain-containing protein [Crocinitomicaceae bacterium]